MDIDGVVLPLFFALVRCPFCSADITTGAGGYAYMRSRAVLHLERCRARATSQASHDLQEDADRMLAASA
jgi:hypothetical protein